MRISFLILMALNVATARAESNAFTFERRGEQICSVEKDESRCFNRVENYAELDLLTHVRTYVEKDSAEATVTIEDLASTAAGFGLNNEQRRDLLARFTQLKVTGLALDPAERKDDHAPLAFFATVEWSDRATPPASGVIYVQGHVGEASKNTAPSAESGETANDTMPPSFDVVQIDKVANATSPLGGEPETKRWLTEVVAPAAVADILMVRIGEKIGDLFDDIVNKIFGADDDEQPAKDKPEVTTPEAPATPNPTAPPAA